MIFVLATSMWIAVRVLWCWIAGDTAARAALAITDQVGPLAGPVLGIVAGGLIVGGLTGVGLRLEAGFVAVGRRLGGPRG